jgi:hypothetical protein
MVHKPIAIMILPIFVAGILMLGILAATANAAENDNAGSGETKAPPPATETPPPAAPPATETPPPAAPPAGASPESNNTGNVQGGDMAKTILAVQNQERAEVGVPPLTWSDKLAAGAQTWAEHMATTGEFGHSTCCGAFRDYGENLAVVKGDNAMGGIVGAGQKFWISEKKDYHGGPFQTIASNGAPGHYTQMVWRTTTEVGCATASGNGGTTAVLVCRYTPPGNTVGQPAY